MAFICLRRIPFLCLGTWRRRKVLTTVATSLFVIILLQLRNNDLLRISRDNDKYLPINLSLDNLITLKKGSPVKAQPKANLSHPVFSNFTKDELNLFEKAWNLQIPWKERTIAQVALIDIVQRHHVLKEKVIYTMNNKQPEGRSRWMQENCPNSPCRFTHKITEKLDAVVYDNDYYYPESIKKEPGQTWIFIRLENPLNPQPPNEIAENIDWMVTYWTSSLLVSTYNNWDKHYPRHNGMRITNFTTYSTRDFSQGKTKKVIWFASNCYARNDRLEYAQHLGKYIQVDIFGSCGTLDCPRSEESECFEKIRKEYKFYLAFENANCNDYITEKFWRALQYDAIPIVMGAKPEEYLQQVPPNSFLHVDDFPSPKELADVLHKLDNDPVLYNKYFEWRKTPGENLEFQQFCRMCAMLHGIDWLEKDGRPNQNQTLMKEYFGEKACVPYWKKRTRYPGITYNDYGQISDSQELSNSDNPSPDGPETQQKLKTTTIRPAHLRNRNIPRYD